MSLFCVYDPEGVAFEYEIEGDLEAGWVAR